MLSLRARGESRDDAMKYHRENDINLKYYSLTPSLMKKRDLLLGLGLFAGFAAQAATSPYTGSVVGEGTYYLYQVETGLWLESNRKDVDQWTTLSKLDDTGFDVQLKKLDGFEGYQIFCNYTANGELNSTDQDRFFLDQGDRQLSDWIFEPVTVAGVTNTYKIMAKARPEDARDRDKIAADIYIGARDGELSDDPEFTTWQLVSREERLKKMQADVEAGNGPVDVSWLIPWYQMDRNNMRDRVWARDNANNNGGSTNFNGMRGYPVQEFWHKCTTRFSYTLTDLPAGTYAFAIQGYYRDGEFNEQPLADRYTSGTENLIPTYFAGVNHKKVKSILSEGKAAQETGFGGFFEALNMWVPNSMDDAGRTFINGTYKNEPVEAGVSDGNLVIGFDKTEEGEHHDWFVIGRMYLYYVSKDVKADDLSGVKNELTELIATAEALPSTPTLAAAIVKAKQDLATANSATAFLKAIDDLKAYVKGVREAKDIITYFHQTKEFTDKEGVSSAEAVELFNTAVSRDDYNKALRKLRYARRRAVRETHEDVFAGAAPEDGGVYYIYNLGQKQFLTAGSSWGAHAALGFPGIPVTLEAEGADEGGFYVNTHQKNGEQDGIAKEYMNYRGYMDCPRIDDFHFEPVPGKENVYYIQQNDYRDVHTAYNPDASVNDGNDNKDETTVGTECRNLVDNPDNLDAQWKLVTPAERDALIEKASLNNPVDLSYRISAPNFLQREDKSAWSLTGEPMPSVEGAGSNRGDFCIEAWNSLDADINQTIAGMPAGVYAVYATAFYRNGHHQNETEVTTEGVGDDAHEVSTFIPGQPDNEKISHCWLQAGSDPADDVQIPNIVTDGEKAPGEGAEVTATDGTVYHYPQFCNQVINFFRLGLYKVHTVIEYDDAEDFYIAVAKIGAEKPKNWLVADNFRAVYYGKDTTKEAVKAKIEAESAIEEIEFENVERPADDRIFNLQGIQVKNPTVPGIYIQNGKKFVVR